jgi:hypothetical protein
MERNKEFNEGNNEYFAEKTNYTQRKEKIILASLLVLLSVASILAGWYLNNSFRPVEKDCSTQVKVEGLWLPDIKEIDNYAGTYICVNIDATDTLNELQKTCQHEIGHEIFSRECEKNFTKCLEVENE